LDSINDKRTAFIQIFFAQFTIQNKMPTIFEKKKSEFRREMLMKFVLLLFLAIVAC